MFTRWRRRAGLLITLLLFASACGSDAEPADEPEPEAAVSAYPDAPITPDGPLSDTVVADIDLLLDSLPTGNADRDALSRIAGADDPRLAWLLSDLMRFVPGDSDLGMAVAAAWIANTGVVVDIDRSIWGATTNHLIAWDTPAPPGYQEWKGRIFTLIEPGWEPFFADGDADIDWRHLSWGGVLIDDRPIRHAALPCPEGCIPALDDPALVAAGTDDDWLDDDRAVFGVVVDGEAVAFPKNIMEVHEMVNMTIGARRVGIPYCTLCGSAQAYLTDVVPAGIDLGEFDTFELRTTGLLTRSNKVMYELHTDSVFDTFTGAALTGPLQDAGVILDQVSVAVTTWGEWKADHPESFLIARDGGIGRTYLDDPLRGRDDDGPIFPIGDVDPRLDVQEPVLGVIDGDTVVAFPVATALATLAAGEDVGHDDLRVEEIGGGLVATIDGVEIATHQAFWFAWSQFHPETEVWSP